MGFGNVKARGRKWLNKYVVGFIKKNRTQIVTDYADKRR
jgi:hypothetical protein